LKAILSGEQDKLKKKEHKRLKKQIGNKFGSYKKIEKDAINFLKYRPGKE